MPQLLFYVECVEYDSDMKVVDVHQSQSGGLPIVYKNEKKAFNRAVSMRDAYIRLGWSQIGERSLPPFRLSSPSLSLILHIAIREVYVHV